MLLNGFIFYKNVEVLPKETSNLAEYLEDEPCNHERNRKRLDTPRIIPGVQLRNADFFK